MLSRGVPNVSSTGRNDTSAKHKGGDTLVVSLSSFIPLKCVDMKSALAHSYTNSTGAQFTDLSTLLETMINFRHLTVKKRMQEAFWQCTGVEMHHVTIDAREAEKVFMGDFHNLMQGANFQMLTEEEFMRSEGDGFILDISSKVDCKNMDDMFFYDFLNSQPQLRKDYHTFDDHILVYHRGVGLSVKEGRFVSDKIELMKDMVVMKPLGFVFKLLTFQKTRSENEPKKTDSYTTDTHTDGTQEKKYERRTLRRVYPYFFKLLFQLFSMVKLSEPTYKEVVIIYRRKAPKASAAKSSEPSKASYLAKVKKKAKNLAGEMSGIKKDKEDLVMVKSFVDVPMADLKLCFPDTIVQVPKFEFMMTALLVFLSMISVISSLLNSTWNTAQLTVTSVLGMRIMSKVDKLTNLKKTLGFKKSLALYDKARNSQEGVITHTTEMMVEQETMQMLLAYTMLLTEFTRDGATNQELDEACEEYLRKFFSVDVDFNVEYGLAKLREYNLITQQGNRTYPIKLGTALAVLDKEWDEYFEYSSNMPNDAPATGTSMKLSSASSAPVLQVENGATNEEVKGLKAELQSRGEEHEVEMKKMKAQQTLLCRKVRELEEAMSEL